MSSSPETQAKKRKRQRPIISCTECHRRKQKCDRQLPCGNCTLRSASHLCQYETKPARRGSDSSSPTSVSPIDSTATTTSAILASAEVTGSFGYVRNRGCSAVDVLEKLDLEDGPWRPEPVLDNAEQAELQNYNRIITTIPPRPYTMLLVKVFFAECNWIYWCVHPGSFCQLLEEWYERCTSKTPPVPSHGKSGDGERRRALSQFPVLLLQMCAVALQMLPREHYKQMSQLNILGKEDFRSLSIAYSNSACELATLLAPYQATLSRVQQWFLRASWLKSEGRAIESWHALGQSIREAQELGLHSQQPRTYNGGVENVASLWQREIEKRVWTNLYVWDRFMSMILGRPTLINDRHCTVTPPLDCNIPNDITRTPPVPRSPLDPPSQFTQRLLDYQLAHMINEIDDLQMESAKNMSHSFEGTDRLQFSIESIIECYPPGLAVSNRDTSHDGGPNTVFLRAQAELLRCSTYSLIVGLHRPFVFTRQKSRIEIVRAGISVLESQQRLLEATREHHHTIYTLNFFTFDPAVLIAAIIITQPLSLSQDLLDIALASIREGQKRMERLGRRVKLAEKGATILSLLIKKAESSNAASQHLRMRNAFSMSPTDSANSFSSAKYTHQSSHSPSSSLANSDSDGWLELPVEGFSNNSTGNCNGFAPINTSILSTRELEEILAAPLPDPMVVTHGLDTTVQFGTGMMDGLEADNFWQNLLYVPFP